MNILFIDGVCPRPYTLRNLRNEALGGTESSVLRVAEGLKNAGHEVSLLQHCRVAAEEFEEGIRHLTADSRLPQPDKVIHLRTATEVATWREVWPDAAHYVWLHDNMLVAEPEMAGQELICVSQWHRAQVVRALPVGWSGPLPSVIYNPVVTSGAKRRDKIPGRLGFFSSPHKGLSQVIELFLKAQAAIPDLSLIVANPGYLPDMHHASIINLGQLNHRQTLEAMSRCQVLFYPQTVFPETFGLVMAEANYMGTPVLAHDMGAAMEVLGDVRINTFVNYVIDCTKSETVEKALDAILGRPLMVPEPDCRFSLENVIKAWEKLLGGE